MYFIIRFQIPVRQKIRNRIPLILVDDIKAKLNSLRSQYNRERGKCYTKSGAGREEADKNKIQWVHFESMRFLNDFILAKPTKSNIVELQVSSKSFSIAIGLHLLLNKNSQL